MYYVRRRKSGTYKLNLTDSQKYFNYVPLDIVEFIIAIGIIIATIIQFYKALPQNERLLSVTSYISTHMTNHRLCILNKVEHFNHEPMPALNCEECCSCSDDGAGLNYWIS